MKQIYASGPLLNGSLNGDVNATPAPGRRLSLPAIRGSSAGLLPHDWQSVLPSALYAPPPAQVPDQPLPIRLALLQTPNGRVLTHVTPNGGTFFSHTLLNVPETADAQLAIQTWGSPLWQRHDPNATGELPELPYLPVADVLDDVSLQDWLGVELHREQLEFALTAFLGTTPDTRIFLSANANDVAKVVYALTRALPGGLLEGFTFSTYEADPLSCTARLIGHESGSADQDLPAACYKGSGVALNSATGKRSDLNASVPFAHFATEALATGQFGPLDEIKATWQRLGLKDARQLDLVYRLSRGTGNLTKDEASEALQHPPLAAWVSANGAARTQFLEWALEDRTFANAAFSRAVQSLRQSADVLAKFAQTVREEGLQALNRGDKNRTANAFEIIFPMVAPTKANAVWGELLASIADPNALSWEMRGYLLPRFVRFKQQQNPNSTVDPVFAAWLDVGADHLGELLALDLPRNYQLAACRATLNQNGEPSAKLAQTLALHPKLTLNLLQAQETPADKAGTLFEALLAEAPGQPWFEDVVAQATDYTPEALNRYFEATLAAGKVDADRLVRTQGARVLELFAGRSGLDTLGKQFLAQLPADLLHNHTVLGFLSQLREQANLSEELRTRLAAVQTLRDYLDQPQFEVERLQGVTAALAVTPPAVPASTKGEIFAAVATELKRRADSPELQADLETVLVHFGSTLATDSTDLYENLLRDLRTRTELARHPKLIEAFLALALGAAHSEDLAGKLDGLDGHAFAVATDAAKRGGNRLLNLLDGRAKEWPKEPRTKWGFLLTAVRPQGFKRTLRDGGFLLAGAAAASLAWWVASLLQ